MKTIKFRVWFKVESRYLSNDEFAFFFDNSGSLEVYTSDMDGDHTIEVTHLVEIEQFTGLQDCEGNDIYEGDIVAKYEQDTSSEEYKDWIENEDFDGYLDENLEALIPMIQSNVDVVTMSRFPVFWLKGEEFGHEGDDLQYSREYKVIGNIHENKELAQC